MKRDIFDGRVRYEPPLFLAELINAMREARAALSTFEAFDPAKIDPEEWREAKRKSLEARAYIAVSTSEIARLWRQPSLHVVTPQKTPTPEAPRLDSTRATGDRRHEK